MKYMNIKEVIDVLKKHNIWRRGADTEMQDPRVLGEAINTAVHLLEGMIKENKSK